MTTVDSMLDHLAKAQWHMSQAIALGHNMPENAIVVTEESLKAIKRAGVQEVSGWVSELYRCGASPGLAPWQGRVGPNPHPAHSYGPSNGQWCDGYI